MRVCVVGGTGNISTSIVRLLREVGHEVTVFNRGGKPVPIPEVKVLRGDLKDRPAFEAVMQAQRFDAAIHMVCYDADDARSALRAFRDVNHLVYCSTVCTYGVQYDWLPVTEDHPLRPITDYGRNKVAADRVFLAAYYEQAFPVTLIKPSTTFGPTWPLLRQIAWEGAWVDRVRKGKPIAICGDGRALHQWMHVDDAAPAFVFSLGRTRCFGQTYNMMKTESGSWADYHRTAMKVIGREVEMVGVPLDTLVAANVPNVGICREIFSFNGVFSPTRLMRDVPEFRPRLSLEEALGDVYEAARRENRIPDSDQEDWEDRLIAAQRNVASASLADKR
jgi:nucleoside-diphosphate-sugar epimerase